MRTVSESLISHTEETFCLTTGAALALRLEEEKITLGHAHKRELLDATRHVLHVHLK